jgi:hypothetical protein
MIVEAIGYDNPKICGYDINAKPWPKCLILGWLNDGTPMHVVLAYNKNNTQVVTAYINPDPNKWESDLCTRKS